MGYRSQVTALVYGPTEKMAGLIMKQRHTGAINLWEANHFGESIEEWDAPADDDHYKGLSFFLLQGDDWKWYPDYTDVRAFTEFMTAAPEHGCAYEFARIGEEDNDVEIERSESSADEGGQEQLWLLNVGSHISCEVGPPYDPSKDTLVADSRRPAEPVPYWGASNVETAMCLWEAFLEFLSQQEPQACALTEIDGIRHARTVVMGWAHECDAAWEEARVNGTADDPFDWEFCPNFLTRKLMQRYAQEKAA